MKEKKIVHIQKVIDEEETLTYKEYERIGYMALGLGILFAGISIVSNPKNLEVAIIYQILSLGFSSACFFAADEVRNNNVKKILINNAKGGLNEFRKK